MASAVAWVIAMPCVAAAVCFVIGQRWLLAVVIPAVAATVVMAGLVAAEVARVGAFDHELGGWMAPLGIRLHADGLSAFMVCIQAGVGTLVSVYALGFLAAKARARAASYLWPLWLLLWGALNGLYLTGDLFNAYVTLELVGVTAVALVAMAGGVALVAAVRYVLVTLFASLVYVLGVALIYTQFGMIDMEAVGVQAAAEPATRVALVLMAVGLLLKTAVFPLHFWLPPAHANALGPVSAILSALVIKGSFYLLVRLWNSVFPGATTASLAEALGVLGVLAVFWGGLQALRQQRLKMIVAYSTVAQVGYLLLAFPLGGMAWLGALYFAAAHACGKGAMFLAAATIKDAVGDDSLEHLEGVAGRLPITVFSFALGSIVLIGLPPTGGFIGKWLILSAAIEAERWLYILVIPIGTLLSAGYVFRFVGPALRELKSPGAPIQVPVTMEISALALALAGVALGFAASPLLSFLAIGAPFGAGG